MGPLIKTLAFMVMAVFVTAGMSAATGEPRGSYDATGFIALYLLYQHFASPPPTGKE